MTVDASPNGGISVEVLSRGDIVVQARVVATATTEEEARAIASRVQVVATAVRVDADGPRTSGRRDSWSVSYRLAVPTKTPLSLKTTNGGITVDAVDSRVDLRTTNGGVKLSRMAGDVEGHTTNGGIDVDLDGTSWQGGGLDVETTNGGVRLAIPARWTTRTSRPARPMETSASISRSRCRDASTDRSRRIWQRRRDAPRAHVERRRQDYEEVARYFFIQPKTASCHARPFSAFNTQWPSSGNTRA